MINFEKFQEISNTIFEKLKNIKTKQKINILRSIIATIILTEGEEEWQNED